MAELILTETVNFVDTLPSTGGRTIVFETDTTANSGDYFIITLSQFGIKNFIGAIGFVHQELRSVVVPENPITLVTTRRLKITVGGVAVNGKKRSYVIFGT